MTTQTTEMSPDALPLGPDVRILQANEDGLLALEKPAGVMSHPNEEGDQSRSLLTVAYNYTKERYSWDDESGVRRHAWLINRLDSPTSGVILVALREDLCTIIKQQFATHRVSKIYTALVKNSPSKLGGVWNDQLIKNLHAGSRRMIKGATRAGQGALSDNSIAEGWFSSGFVEAHAGDRSHTSVACAVHEAWPSDCGRCDLR